MKEITIKFRDRYLHDNGVLFVLVTSLFIHIGMLFVSGVWWDDYKFLICNSSELRGHFISAGRIDAFLIVSLIDWLPIPLIRLIISLCNAITAIFIYKIIQQVTKDSTAALWISVLFNAIPVNDARILECVFPYVFAQTCFWIASFLLLKTIHDEKWLSFNRFSSLILFFIAFSTNSFLVFYAIPIIFLWFLLSHLDMKIETPHYFLIKYVFRYLDFYLLPFSFFIIKKLFLSPDPNGLYSDYNVVTISKCSSAFTLLYSVTIDLLKKIFTTYKDLLITYKLTTALLLLVLIISFLFRHKITQRKSKIMVSLGGVFCGFVIVFLAVYPYLVIRQSYLDIKSYTGRDSFLVCLGVAVILFYLIDLIPLPHWIHVSCYSFIILLSFCLFSLSYLSYQRDTYCQKALEYAWLNCENIKNGTTFIYIKQDNTQTLGDRFYSVNAMASETFSNSSRFFANGIGDLSLITSYEKKDYLHSDSTYGFSDYDMSNTEINGFFTVNYRIPLQSIFSLKISELFNQEQFRNNLLQFIDFSFYPVSSNQSKRIYELIQNGTISNNEELLSIYQLGNLD